MRILATNRNGCAQQVLDSARCPQRDLGRPRRGFAIQEALNGNPVEWMEKVSDEHYRA
jgi:hypothetical protein